ncbi:MAG TPA: T9SS type A sorting domain-containing protein, partial [Rubricoccaceae bacterium]|nr:T9SS type A sorting domain-containing protein [Rubricoccaceae bacterium]
LRNVPGAPDAGVVFAYAGPVPEAIEPGAPVSAFTLAVTPNPSGGAVAISLRLPFQQVVRLALYDALGREVGVLHAGPLAAGAHRLPLNASALPAGVYFVRADAEEGATTRALTVLR